MGVIRLLEGRYEIFPDHPTLAILVNAVAHCQLVVAQFQGTTDMPWALCTHGTPSAMYSKVAKSYDGPLCTRCNHPESYHRIGNGY